VNVPTDLQGGERLGAMCGLFKDRCATTAELADWLFMYVSDVNPPSEELQARLNEANRPAIAALASRLEQLDTWEAPSIAQSLKDTLTEFGLKMPLVAIPVRLLVCGRAQTPSVDAVLALFEQKIVVQRLRNA